MNVSKRLLVKLATGVVALTMVLIAQVTPASAAVLQIQMTGMNLSYTGGATGGVLCDATSCLGGSGIAAQSDPIITANFLVDGVLVGTLNSNIWLDVYIDVNTGLADNGGNTVATTGGAGGTGLDIFDLVTAPVLAGWGLALNLGSGALLFSDNLLSFTGIASVAAIFAQALPFGLVIDDPVIVTYSANITASTTAGGFYTSFSAAGTPDIIGQQAVPEPASILLLGSGLAFAARQVRRRRASR